jgi:succinoglycan biosynthesis transport protein ExoP
VDHSGRSINDSATALTVRQGLSSDLVYLEPLQPLAANSDDAGGVAAVWQLLKGRRLLIALLSLAGVAGSLLFSMVQTPIYEARATLEFQSARNGEEVFGVNESDSGFTPESYLQTQVKVLQSRALFKRVMAKLEKEPGRYQYSVPSHLEKWRSALLFRHDGLSATHPITLPKVDAQIRILDNSRIVEIACFSASPRLAADFAGGLASEYIDSNMEAVWETAQKTSDWLTRQLEGLRARLEASENQLQEYTRNSGLVFTGSDQNMSDEQLRQIQKELSDAQADRIAKESAYEVASTTPVEALPQVLDNTKLADYQSKLSELRRSLAELTSVYTPAYYKVVQVQAQVNELETTLRRERTNIIGRIRSEYQAALKRERLLSAAYASQLQKASEEARKAINYSILKREVDTNRQVYDQLLQKAKQIGIGSALRSNNVRIVDGPEVPTVPSKPDLFRNGVTGLASGLGFALCFVFAGEFINRSLRAPGETPVHLRVPELGVIPSRNSVSEQVLLPTVMGLKSSEGIGQKARLELVTWQDRPSLLAESYRNALTSLLASNGKGRPKVIMITSSAHGEGKSTTVSNLGIALAEINQRVLLIDADMRKPHLHEIFDLPNTWGLSDLLRERSSLRDCPVEAIARKTAIENLSVLPSGPGAVSITNLLYSSRMVDLIARARNEFDATIIDTPPMSYLSDARVLGQLADGAILVIRAAKTTRDEARMAKQRLVDDGIRVLGTILNGWDLKSKTRYGYNGYTA